MALNLLDKLKADHRGFESTLERLEELSEILDKQFFADETAARAAQEADAILENLISEISAHEDLEDRLLFPEIRERMPEAASGMAQADSDHQRLRRLLDDALSRLPTPARAAHRPAKSLRALIAALRGHILREETGVYALAQEGIPAGELERLSVMEEDAELVELGSGD